ncbi:MAG: ATP-binding protein [Clostridia bacterium]|nr:ATP-binding protein [Clostridia bacterium]
MATKVNANPTKEFFISMLTRDIDIKAAILELIDNSIDGAKRLRPEGDYTGLYVNIKYDKDSFCISDNCGGMSIETATQYAFRFGRSNDRPREEKHHFTGVFGIGMKRSLFRMGNYFEVTSATNTESFDLKVDVDEWVKSDETDWSFNLSNEKTGLNNADTDTGTTITVKKLHDGIAKQFDLKYFFSALITHIERYKTIAVENGLQITVNDTPISFSTEQILRSKDIIPYSFSETIDNVTIKIIAGIAPKGHPENAGWYVYCNGRLVVHADKTNLSIWGEDGVRNYHPSLAFFRGFLFFESTDLDELPWNTTKTSVDASSKYYIFAKVKMKEATLDIIKNSNALSEDNISADIEKEMFSNKNLVYLNTNNISTITAKNTLFSLNLPEIKAIEQTTTISFKKPTAMVEKAKKAMQVSTNKDVGLYAFDYYFDRECDEDE